MGIKGLMKVIHEHAPNSITETTLKNLFGRKICIDASMTLYQYLIAVRTDEANNYTLLSETGEPTSHLSGLFYSTIKMMENGIKPVYIFDGSPPKLKGAELLKRSKLREEAECAINEAKERGDMEALSKFNKRTVHVTQKHNKEARYLLELMGIPVIQAPSEAEAQCATLVKAGICYASGSEDMDSLTLGVPLLLRRLTFSKMKNLPILEINLEKVLIGLKMNMDEFIDLCILLGCDYCDSIRGIGAKRAVQLIQKYSRIEKILDILDLNKYKVPDYFPFEEVRELFRNPKILNTNTLEIKWDSPNSQALIEFLVREKAFSEDRVKKGIEKIERARRAFVQGRITSFFTNKITNMENNIASNLNLLSDIHNEQLTKRSEKLKSEVKFESNTQKKHSKSVKNEICISSGCDSTEVVDNSSCEFKISKKSADAVESNAIDFLMAKRKKLNDKE